MFVLLQVGSKVCWESVKGEWIWSQLLTRDLLNLLGMKILSNFFIHTD